MLVQAIYTCAIHYLLDWSRIIHEKTNVILNAQLASLTFVKLKVFQIVHFADYKTFHLCGMLSWESYNFCVIYEVRESQFNSCGLLTANK